MHVKDLAARYEALISASEPTPASPQPASTETKLPPNPPDEMLSGPGTVSALTRRIEAVVLTDDAVSIPVPSKAPVVASDNNEKINSTQTPLKEVTLTPLSPRGKISKKPTEITSSTISVIDSKTRRDSGSSEEKSTNDSSGPKDDDEDSFDDFVDVTDDFLPPVPEGSLDDIEDAEPVSDGSLSGDPITFHRIPTALTHHSTNSSSGSPAHSPVVPVGRGALPPEIPNISSMTRALSFSPDIRALSPDIRIIASPVLELEPSIATSRAKSRSASPASSSNGFESPKKSFSNRVRQNPPSFKLHPSASRRPRTSSSPRQPSSPRSSFAPSSGGPSSAVFPSRTGSNALSTTPSLKKLPKAKVILARRRVDPMSTNSTGSHVMSPPMSRHSLDLPAARQLVREYSHPRELFAGHVSLLPSTPPESPPMTGNHGPGVQVPPINPLSALVKHEPVVATRPFSDPFGASETGEASSNAGGANGGAGRSGNRKGNRQHYDDFMDPDDLPGRRHRERDGENMAADGFPTMSNSKKRYNNKKWFGGNDEKEKERRRHERIERSSSVISGALDRVSMAADPWIDFITDTNGVGIPNKNGGPLRRAMKKLFGRRGHPTLIKDVE